MGLDVHNGLRCSKSNAPTVSCSFLTEGKNQSQRVHSITSSAANTINELLPPSGLLGASGQGSCGYASDGQGCSLASRSLRSSGSVVKHQQTGPFFAGRTQGRSITNQTKGQGLKQSLGASTRSADADAVAPVVAWEESMRSQHTGILTRRLLLAGADTKLAPPNRAAAPAVLLNIYRRCPNWYVMGFQPAAAAIDRELEAILDAPDTSPGPGSSGIAFKLPHNAMW